MDIDAVLQAGDDDALKELKLFLFKPVNAMIEKRRKLIDGQLSDAAQKQKEAEAEKQAAILRAEAQKERMIKEAEGQAEAVMKVQKANAEGIRMIREAGADQAVLTLKSLEAFAKAADGKSTKIIIPSEIQGIAGLASSLKEIVTEEKKEDVQ